MAPTNGQVRFELEDRLDLLEITPGFDSLDRAQLVPLAKRARGRLFHRNEFIFYEGDPPDFFHVLASGRARVCKHSPSGKIFTAWVIDRGDTLNAVVLFENRERFLSAQALVDSVVMLLPRDDFVSFVSQHPSVALGIISVLGQLVQNSYERILDMISERVEQRIINVLYMLNYKFGNPLKFTNRELAALAGTTTETTCRVLSQLRDEGLLKTSRGQIRIMNSSHLETLGRGPFWF